MARGKRTKKTLSGHVSGLRGLTKSQVAAFLGRSWIKLKEGSRVEMRNIDLSYTSPCGAAKFVFYSTDGAAQKLLSQTKILSVETVKFTVEGQPGWEEDWTPEEDFEAEQRARREAMRNSLKRPRAREPHFQDRHDDCRPPRKRILTTRVGALSPESFDMTGTWHDTVTTRTDRRLTPLLLMHEELSRCLGNRLPDQRRHLAESAKLLRDLVAEERWLGVREKRLDLTNSANLRHLSEISVAQWNVLLGMATMTLSQLSLQMPEGNLDACEGLEEALLAHKALRMEALSRPIHSHAHLPVDSGYVGILILLGGWDGLGAALDAATLDVATGTGQALSGIKTTIQDYRRASRQKLTINHAQAQELLRSLKLVPDTNDDWKGLAPSVAAFAHLLRLLKASCPEFSPHCFSNRELRSNLCLNDNCKAALSDRRPRVTDDTMLSIPYAQSMQTACLELLAGKHMAPDVACPQCQSPTRKFAFRPLQLSQRLFVSTSLPRDLHSQPMRFETTLCPIVEGMLFVEGSPGRSSWRLSFALLASGLGPDGLLRDCVTFIRQEDGCFQVLCSRVQPHKRSAEQVEAFMADPSSALWSDECVDIFREAPRQGDKCRVASPMRHLHPVLLSYELSGEGFPGLPEVSYGALLDAYPDLGKLGQGALGAVYKSADSDGEGLAVKRTLPGVHINSASMLELKALCGLWASGGHPHIVRLLGLHLDLRARKDRSVAMTLPLLDGTAESLVIRLGFEVPMQSIKKILHGTALGLWFMHKQQFLHLEVKPGNVGVKDGEGVLLDMGSATRLQGADWALVPICTTPCMSGPEFDDANCDRGLFLASRASDVYGLAVTAFFLLSGGFFPCEPLVRNWATAKLNSSSGTYCWDRPLLRRLSAAQTGLLAAALAVDPAARPELRTFGRRFIMNL